MTRKWGEHERLDAYYANGRGGYLVRVYGVHLKTKAGKERRFKSREAAEKAGEKHIAWLREFADMTRDANT